jgi:hypothetical protein
MMIIAPPASPHREDHTAFEFDDFESFACGCVAARFRVVPWAGHILRIETKGPYCPFDQHACGAIVGIGLRSDAMSSDEAGLVGNEDSND